MKSSIAHTNTLIIYILSMSILLYRLSVLNRVSHVQNLVQGLYITQMFVQAGNNPLTKYLSDVQTDFDMNINTPTTSRDVTVRGEYSWIV
jgi:hypothetical protein